MLRDWGEKPITAMAGICGWLLFRRQIEEMARGGGERDSSLATDNDVLLKLATLKVSGISPANGDLER